MKRIAVVIFSYGLLIAALLLLRKGETVSGNVAANGPIVHGTKVERY
jgi:hypothetical protein